MALDSNLLWKQLQYCLSPAWAVGSSQWAAPGAAVQGSRVVAARTLRWALVVYFQPALSGLTCMISHFPRFTEEPRGGQLREDTQLGTRPLASNHLHRPQHRAAPAFLQRPQSSFQQQSDKQVRGTLREPCPLPQLLSK